MGKAKEFSELSLLIARRFWDACFSFSEGPEYLGKLDYKKHYDIACEISVKRKALESSSYLVEGK